MSNTIEFIKKHAPKLGSYAESLVEKTFCHYHFYVNSNELEDAFDWGDHILGHDFWFNVCIATAENLKSIEKELTKAFGSEHPKEMFVRDNDAQEWRKEKIVFIGKENCYVDENGDVWHQGKEISTITKEQLIKEASEKHGLSEDEVEEILN